MPNDRINWYPGHMAKSRRLLQDQLRAVDAVIELCDARAPLATRNPDLGRLTRGKTRILVLNKADLADDAQTARWLERFRREGLTALRFNSNGGKVKDILGHIENASKPALERYAARGVRKTVRFMVIGIPNVGKSTFINRLHGSAIVKASDRPGVTRANQWVKLGPFLEILDTPGMLPPRMDDQEGARLLAYLGSIRDEIMDTEDLAGGLMALLNEIKPEALKARYKLPDDCGGEPHALLEGACRGRGWLLSGGRYDTARAAALVLDEFRAGRIGKITIERA
ncbi:MAG: ribosome biogenesis GTPase YlqF [Clostridia bacterium]|nr:ribosome biogenesis GTPase YlqF [Clostridia bacterium]MBR3274757.1 ribosome biogenesis GTPase YlqF [Clostridia bacterium]